MKLSNAEIQQGIAKLPDNIREAVLGFDWAGEIMAIGKEYRMHMDEIDLFRQQTLAIILGKSPATEYESHLINEVGLSKSVAQAILIEANARIFKELQHRAFSPVEKNNQHEIDEDTSPTHHEIKDTLKDEGILLLDEEGTSSLDTDLHKEVAMIMSGKETITDMPVDDSNQIETSVSDTILETSNNADTANYTEPITENDLKGIRGHRTNTEILHQENPEAVFETSSSFSNQRDLGQGDYTKNQSLDKKILSERQISSTETMEVEKDIPGISDENFLERLSE